MRLSNLNKSFKYVILEPVKYLNISSKSKHKARQEGETAWPVAAPFFCTQLVPAKRDHRSNNSTLARLKILDKKSRIRDLWNCKNLDEELVAISLCWISRVGLVQQILNAH